MTPAKFTWVVGLVAQVVLVVLLIVAGPFTVLPALLLLAPLFWMWRRSAYAHAVNSLMVLLYIGGGLTFIDTRSGLLVACVGVVAFVANILHVRFVARDRKLGR